MSFVATGTTTTAGEPIENNGFWPQIDPADFREAQRVDGTVTAPRVRDALVAAMIDANNRLRAWQQTQQQTGRTAIDDVPAPEHLPPGAYASLYRRAVYALAKANLIERYRDYDSTGAAHDRMVDLEGSVDDYRRDASWAIADIVGRGRTTVELI